MAADVAADSLTDIERVISAMIRVITRAMEDVQGMESMFSRGVANALAHARDVSHEWAWLPVSELASSPAAVSASASTLSMSVVVLLVTVVAVLIVKAVSAQWLQFDVGLAAKAENKRGVDDAGAAVKKTGTLDRGTYAERHEPAGFSPNSAASGSNGAVTPNGAGRWGGESPTSKTPFGLNGHAAAAAAAAAADDSSEEGQADTELNGLNWADRDTVEQPDVFMGRNVERDEDFPGLTGIAMLDAAGAPPPPKRLLEDCFSFLASELVCNPHSQFSGNWNSVSEAPLPLPVQRKLSNVRTIDDIRALVLAQFDAPPGDYEVIYTSGATHAMKLMADCLPWRTSMRRFIYCRDAHTSMMGIREAAMKHGRTVDVVMERGLLGRSGSGDDAGADAATQARQFEEGKAQWDTQRLHHGKYDSEERKLQRRFGGKRFTLVGMTMECNLSGRRRSERMMRNIRERSSGLPHERDVGRTESVLLLLDAAKAAATSPVSLRETGADFLCVSFYKMFGYPTGLGALVVSKRALKLMEEGQQSGDCDVYFGGGTVEGAASGANFLARKKGPAAFEHGTPNFQAIVCLPIAMRYLGGWGGIGVVQQKTAALATKLAVTLSSLSHVPSGAPAVELYGPCAVNPAFCFYDRLQGPTVAFNLLAPDGSYIGYNTVVRIAELNGIYLRGGCHCNPGACEIYLGIDHQHKHESGLKCGDSDRDILDGKAMGCVRASFGWHSTYDDVDRLVDLIRGQFVESVNAALMGSPRSPAVGRGTVERILIYPIKSCAGVDVTRWPLTSSGKLLYDREWAFVDDNGVTLSQKRHPQLATITPTPDLQEGVLRITSSIYKDDELVLPLEETSYMHTTVKVCGKESTCAFHEFSNPSHAAWLERVTGTRCRLVRSVGSRTLANTSELLVINAASLELLRSCLRSQGSKDASRMAKRLDAVQFRPNLLVSGFRAHGEDSWHSLRLLHAPAPLSPSGAASVQPTELVTCGPCARCTMVNVDFREGQRGTAEPLRTLAQYRLSNGEIHFGMRMRPILQVTALDDATDDTDAGMLPSRWLERGMNVHSL